MQKSNKVQKHHSLVKKISVTGLLLVWMPFLVGQLRITDQTSITLGILKEERRSILKLAYRKWKHFLSRPCLFTYAMFNLGCAITAFCRKWCRNKSVQGQISALQWWQAVPNLLQISSVLILTSDYRGPSSFKHTFYS